MLRKIILFVVILIVLLAGIVAWLTLTSATNFESKSKYLYIRSDKATYNDLLQTIKDSNYIQHINTFEMLARRMDLEEKIKPGRYELKKGMSLVSIVRLLRNGTQAPVNLVITKLRTKEDLAAFVGKRFECDSVDVIKFLNNPDSLRGYDLDTNTAMTGIFPNSYQLFWNSDASTVFKKLFQEKDKFWTAERIKKAEDLKITPTQAYILASIVEEETRASSEKDTMASVYLNRVYKGMRLQADPTVKFALKDFGLKRIYEKHLAVESPYNTYRNTGLPPGPICTPSPQSLEAVLRAPSTNYLYFVAKSDFSGRHVFSATYEEHLIHRREFQEAQDRQQKIRAAKEDTGS